MKTNEELMASYRIENNIDDSVTLLTFGEWKKMGFKVRKGEKSKHILMLWSYQNKEVGDEEKPMTIRNRGYCYLRKAHLFDSTQVEPFKK